MKKYFPLTIIFILLIACNEKNEFESKLKIENDSLRNKIKELDTQIQMTDSLKSIYQVTIANTAVRDLSSKFNNQKYQIKISFSFI